MAEKLNKPSPVLPSPDLPAIAAILTEAAQALTEISSTGPRHVATADQSTATGETRCYYFSPATLKHERELFQKYRVNDFSGLLAEAHTLLDRFRFQMVA